MRGSSAVRTYRIAWALSSGLLLGIACLGTACDGKPVPYRPDTMVEKISDGSAAAYLQGMRAWGVSIVNHEVRDARARTLRAIIASLDEAIVNDPRCPLLYSKKADLLLELNPDDPATLDQAESLYQRSFGDGGVRAWIPGMLGMADVWYRRALRDPTKWSEYEERAKACVLPGWLHMNALERHNDKPPKANTGLFAGLFGAGAAAEPEKQRPGDPVYDQEARYGMLMDLLYADDAWRIDNEAVLLGASVADAALNNGGSPLVRRLRGRLQAEKCRWFIGPSGVSPDPRAALETALKWDRDSFALSMAMGRQFRVLGDSAHGTMEDYTHAAAYLRRWAEPSLNANAMLQAYKPLLQELMRVCVGMANRIERGIDPDGSAYDAALKGAGAYYARLTRIDDHDAQTETIRAWSLLVQGVRGGDAKVLQSAIVQADVALTMQDPPREEIETVQRTAREAISRLAQGAGGSK